MSLEVALHMTTDFVFVASLLYKNLAVYNIS